MMAVQGFLWLTCGTKEVLEFGSIKNCCTANDTQGEIGDGHNVS